MQVGIVGLGLIGGSLAKALHATKKHRVFGIDKEQKVMQAALAEGVISAPLEAKTIALCDLIILCLFPQGERAWLQQNADDLKGKIVVTTSGVQQKSCANGWQLADEKGFVFVGGHPMAGREKSGFFAAREELFSGATMLLLPNEAPLNPAATHRALATLVTLFSEIGFGQVKQTGPLFHDQMIAYTSQLAHLASSAYIKSDLAWKAAGFTGGSFQDMTRVALLNPDMWTNLFLENQPPLLEALDAYLQELELFKQALAQKDAEALHRLLADGSARKEQSNRAFAAAKNPTQKEN